MPEQMEGYATNVQSLLSFFALLGTVASQKEEGEVGRWGEEEEGLQQIGSYQEKINEDFRAALL